MLGLPFDLTKYVAPDLAFAIFELLFHRSEFIEVFSRYGTVAHAVILATVDNASRRRGFIVMNTHQEAKNAMSNLSRTELKSVSYTLLET